MKLLKQKLETINIKYEHMCSYIIFMFIFNLCAIFIIFIYVFLFILELLMEIVYNFQL